MKKYLKKKNCSTKNKISKTDIKPKTDDIKKINNFYVNKIGKNIMIKKKKSWFNWVKKFEVIWDVI